MIAQASALSGKLRHIVWAGRTCEPSSRTIFCEIIFPCSKVRQMTRVLVERLAATLEATSISRKDPSMSQRRKSLCTQISYCSCLIIGGFLRNTFSTRGALIQRLQRGHRIGSSVHRVTTTPWHQNRVAMGTPVIGSSEETTMHSWRTGSFPMVCMPGTFLSCLVGNEFESYLDFLPLFLAAARWARTYSTTRCISWTGAGLPLQISN